MSGLLQETYYIFHSSVLTLRWGAEQTCPALQSTPLHTTLARLNHLSGHSSQLPLRGRGGEAEGGGRAEVGGEDGEEGELAGGGGSGGGRRGPRRTALTRIANQYGYAEVRRNFIKKFDFHIFVLCR